MTTKLPTGVERRRSEGISCLVRAGAPATSATTSTGNGHLPLVLLHGIGSNASTFAALIAALPADRPVLAWDAPGYGSSDPLPMDHPISDDYAAAAAAVLDRLSWPVVDLLGHSLGALMAGRLAARSPARVRRLVLASPALGYGTSPGAPLAPQAGNRLVALKAEGAAVFASTRGPRLVHDRANTELVAGVTRAMSEVRLPGYAHACHMLSCGNLIGDAARIQAPTLVLVGAEDETTPPANCRRMADALIAAAPARGHRFELVERAGHAVVQEQPVAVARLVASFLNQADLVA